MSAVNTIWNPEDLPQHYYKVQGFDGKWYIAKGYPNGPSVKGGLTEEEANAFLKLLRED